MTTKEFNELVLDEQRKWGEMPGTVLIESREVKLPLSQGKSEPEKKADPLAKITDAMYAKLTYGSSYIELPQGIHLSEAKKVKLPDGIHQKLSEAIGSKPSGTLPENIHERMRRAFGG